MRSRSPLSLFLLLLAVPIARAQEAEAGWSRSDLSWQGSLDQGRRIEISNPYGDLRARFSADDTIALSAVVQRRDGDPHEAEIVTEASPDGYVIAVAYPTLDGRPATGGRPERRVDLVVFVPGESEIVLSTEFGLIEAKKLRSEVVARSQSGEVRLSTRGDIHARSERGDVTVSFPPLDGEGESRIETRTGDIRIVLSPTSNVTVRGSTNGRVTTDYSVDIEQQNGTRWKETHTVLGSGSYRLRLESDRGDLELLREPST